MKPVLPEKNDRLRRFGWFNKWNDINGCGDNIYAFGEGWNAHASHHTGRISGSKRWHTECAFNLWWMDVDVVRAVVQEMQRYCNLFAVLFIRVDGSRSLRTLRYIFVLLSLFCINQQLSHQSMAVIMITPSPGHVRIWNNTSSGSKGVERVNETYEILDHTTCRCHT